MLDYLLLEIIPFVRSKVVNGICVGNKEAIDVSNYLHFKVQFSINGMMMFSSKNEIFILKRNYLFKKEIKIPFICK